MTGSPVSSDSTTPPLNDVESKDDAPTDQFLRLLARLVAEKWVLIAQRCSQQGADGEDSESLVISVQTGKSTVCKKCFDPSI